jgi:hypothetical protein
MKERLTQKLLDGDLRTYLMEKEHWNAQYFESIDWTSYSTAFKILSKGKKTDVATVTHTYGTPEPGTNNTMEVKNCAACATVRQKTGDTL